MGELTRLPSLLVGTVGFVETIDIQNILRHLINPLSCWDNNIVFTGFPYRLWCGKQLLVRLRDDLAQHVDVRGRFAFFQSACGVHLRERIGDVVQAGFGEFVRVQE